MGKLGRFLTIASIIGVTTPVAGQDRPLLPQLDDPRLWSSAWSVVPPPVGTRLSPPPARTGLGSSFAAGYLFGGLLSLPLGEAAAPPKELGLWLRGWYKGSMDPSPSDRSSFGQGVHGLGFLAPATSHWGDDPPFVDGIVNGFLDALAITFGK